MKYQAILRAVQQTPWAILPEKFAEIVEFLHLKADGIEFTAEEIEARTSGKKDRPFSMSGSAAVIPVMGTILYRGSMLSETSGLTTVSGIRRQLRAAMADKDVKSVVLEIDSPGGSVEGLPEIATELRESRKAKRIVAQVDTLAASAAYYIASQADEIVVTPSGETGSIGVFAAHRDFSEMLKQRGVKTTLVHAGKHKVELNPFEPLTKDAKATIQKTVDEFYGMFLSDVAAGRGISVETVEKKFGQGRVFRAEESVKRGMADRIATTEQTIVEENVKAELGEAANSIRTKREMERFLRYAGFARERAAAIASHGWTERDAGSEHERDAGAAAMEAFLKRAEEILTV